MSDAPALSSADTRSPEPWALGRIVVNASTYNERDNIDTLIDRVLAARDDLHMLVVDDNSPDGTGARALERAATEPRLHVLVRRGRRGLGSAILEGLHEARRHGFEIAVYMDADLSHDPDDIPRLLAAMEPPGGRLADLAVGSRRVPGGRTVGWPLSREVMSRLVCWFTRWILWVPVRDGSGGFRAVRLALLDRITPPESKGYAFQEDLLWRLHRAGARIVEVPITFIDRTHGASKADFAETRRSIGDLLKLARRTWLGR
jgi:dolichol-phosphate mannosyltransferase